MASSSSLSSGRVRNPASETESPAVTSHPDPIALNGSRETSDDRGTRLRLRGEFSVLFLSSDYRVAFLYFIFSLMKTIGDQREERFFLSLLHPILLLFLISLPLLLLPCFYLSLSLLID